MVSPDFVHGIRKSLEHNLNTHAAFSKPEKNCGYVTAMSADGSIYYPEEYQISEDGKQVKPNWALDFDKEQTFPFVSVLTVDGPITRNGGACSYGSIDHRNMMMRAANHPLCRGHIFIINTPGGSAWAKNDYEQAIQYARSLSQPVIAFVDGMCASAGMYLASLCDECYYMHPKNQIGCIGVMAAFYTEADGSTNKYTNETYHELYDPESFDKNRAFRDIANDGKDAELIKELAELGVEFRADVKKACPGATDEHLHGKIFNAEDVTGILVDAHSDFFSTVKRAFDLYSGEAEPIKRTVAAPTQPAVKTDTNTTATNTNIVNMENYPLINAACGLKAGEIAVTEEGAYMNASLLDSLEANMKASEQKVTNAEQKATEAENALAVLQSKFDELSAQLTAAVAAKEVAEDALTKANEAHSNELEKLNAQNTEAANKKDEELNAAVAAKDQAEAELKEAKDALATAQQLLTDTKAQVAELANEAGGEPEAGAAPKSNGEGANVEHAQTAYPTWNAADPVASKKAIEEYKRKNGLG